MPSMNFSDGFVLDRTLRFQTASAASYAPPRRPTRGSDVGATETALERDIPGGAQAAAAITIAANAEYKDAVRKARDRRSGWPIVILGSSERAGDRWT